MKLVGKDKLNKRIELANPVLDEFNKWLKTCNVLPKKFYVQITQKAGSQGK